jgi:hypothetical protein
VEDRNKQKGMKGLLDASRRPYNIMYKKITSLNNLTKPPGIRAEYPSNTYSEYTY